MKGLSENGRSLANCSFCKKFYAFKSFDTTDQVKERICVDRTQISDFQN